MLHAMDQAGIDLACLFQIFHPDGTTGNDLAARFIAQHPDRFVAFAYVSPTMPERMVPELTRAIDELNFVAIKLYPPFTPWEFNQPPWQPIYEFVNERNLTIIFHTDHLRQNRPGFWPTLPHVIRKPTSWPVIRVTSRRPELKLSLLLKPIRTFTLKPVQLFVPQA